MSFCFFATELKAEKQPIQNTDTETPPHLPPTPSQLAHSQETCDLGALSHASPRSLLYPPPRVTTRSSMRLLNSHSDVAHALPTYRVLLSPHRPHTRPPSWQPERAPPRGDRLVCTGAMQRRKKEEHGGHGFLPLPPK